MTEKRVSSRYARALLSTAKEADQVDTVFNDLDKIKKITGESRDFYNLLKSPVIPFWQKKDILKEILEPAVSELTLKFVLLLADKRRESMLGSIIEEYVRQYNEFKNRIPVAITSAVELQDEIRQKIQSKLEEVTEKIVLSDFIVDERLKGGILIRIRDWVYDASIRNQLQVLHEKLASEGIKSFS